MKKKWIAVLTVISVSLAFSACSKETETEENQNTVQQGTEEILPEVTEDPEDPEAVEQNNTLVMGIEENNPPYSYRNENGEYVGFDVDLAVEACKRLGYDLKIQSVDWQEKDSQVNNGTLDFAWHGLTEEESSVEGYDITFASSNTALRDMIQGTLQDMQEDKTVQQIAEKWDVKLPDSAQQ